MKTGIVVSVVSSYPVAGEGLSSILREYASKITIYHSAINFLSAYGSDNYQTDLVIIDSNIGVSVVEMMTWELCQKRPESKILVIASENDNFSSKSFLYSGVNAIVNKDALPKEILHAISRVLGNDRYFSPGIQYKLLQGILSQQKYMEVLKVDYNLSEKEIMIIRFVCAQKKSKEIATLLSLSQRTVEGMRARILRKLRLENGMGLILFGLKHNLITMNDAKKAA